MGRRISLKGFESSLIRVSTRLKSYTKWSRKRRSISVSIPSMRNGRPRGTLDSEDLRTASSIFCFPLFHISFGGYPSHTTAFFWQFRHDGFVSSHFFFLRRQVIQPVFERPFAIFVLPPGVGSGCFRGRPRFLGTTAVESVLLAVSGAAISSFGFILARTPSSSSSSSSSILGVTSFDFMSTSGEEITAKEYVVDEDEVGVGSDSE